MEVRMDTPEEVPSGRDRVLYRFGAVNLSARDQSVAVGVALDGLPEGCSIDDMELWSSVGNDPQWPSFPRLNPRGQEIIEGAALPVVGLRDLSDECEGTFELVVRATVVGSGEHETLRVPITVT
jgi:hypothetical protein